MKRVVAAALVAASAGTAQADGFMMGSGQWTCGQAIEAWGGSAVQKGQLAGWIMGYWSAATTTREKSFVDTVERVGGLKIVEATLGECQKAGPETMLYRVTQGMIASTK